MVYSIFRQYIACLLIALIPIQAAAAGRLALCAEMTGQSRAAMTMEHCTQMASMTTSTAKDATPAHHEDKNCWLGSVCSASMAAFALPMKHQFAPIERDASISLSTITLHYRSVILDSPQRPPTIL